MLLLLLVPSSAVLAVLFVFPALLSPAAERPTRAIEPSAVGTPHPIIARTPEERDRLRAACKGTGPEHGMIAGCWDFERHTDQLVADASGNGNFMYPGNAMDLRAALVPEQFGNALRLGESNHYLAVIPAPDSALAHLSQPFTVVFRMKTDDLKQDSVILAYSLENVAWTIGLKEGSMLFGQITSGDRKGCRVTLANSLAGRFIHIAVVFTAASGPETVYLNGTKADVVRETAFWGASQTHGFLIGCRRRDVTTPGEPYHGLLDDLAVLTQSLDAAQVQALVSKPYGSLFKFPAVAFPDKPFFWDTVYTGRQLGHDLMTEIRFAGLQFDLSNLPLGLEVDPSGELLINHGMRVQKIQAWPRPLHKVDVTRGFVAPNGDWLVMVAAGRSQYGYPRESWHVKTNDMIQYRSTDHGKTWSGPTLPWSSNYTSSFVVPFIPRGSERIYVFGNEVIPQERENKEDTPITYRYSDDNGLHWSDPVFIRPRDFPDYTGICAMLMCETKAGTWLLGTHTGSGFLFSTADGPMKSRQFVLRSTDQGKNWTLLPTTPVVVDPEPYRRVEGRVINLSDGGALLLARTSEGHLWATRSEDDGLTWSAPAALPPTHPAAPPMLFHLSDGKTLVQLVHNRFKPNDRAYHQLDRNELWVCISKDDGATWSEPAFLMANLVSDARRPNLSYTDMFTADGQVHFIVPHLWEQVLRVSMPEQDLFLLPTEGATVVRRRPPDSVMRQ